MADAHPVTPDAMPVSPDASHPTGLTHPCTSGPGFTLFRFHYSPSLGDNADVDVWDATCSYSFAPGSACNATGVSFNFGSQPTTTDGGQALEIAGTDYLRVRYSVAGLSFTNATLYVQARSLSTGASTNFDVWSPIYGDRVGGPVTVDFTYSVYPLDWTGMLDPSDDPALTAIQISAMGGSEDLGIHMVEMCVQ